MTDKNATPTLGQNAQALLARGVFALLGLLPMRAASALGGRIARAVGPLTGKSRVARRNIERAMPELSSAEVDRVLLGMWENLGRTAFEFPHLDNLRYGDADADVHVIGVENIHALRDDGRPGLFFSAHMANWETASRSIVKSGLPVHVIYRAPNNPAMEKLYDARYPGAGEMLTKGIKGAKRALQLLAAGEHLGFLIDQKMNDGIPVPFFGRDAMTAPALAQFALRYDCPVVPVRVERLGGCKFRITHYPPMHAHKTGDAQADVLDLMTRVNAVMEGWIRERPEEWFWVHRRWPD